MLALIIWACGLGGAAALGMHTRHTEQEQREFEEDLAALHTVLHDIGGCDADIAWLANSLGFTQVYTHDLIRAGLVRGWVEIVAGADSSRGYRLREALGEPSRGDHRCAGEVVLERRRLGEAHRKP